MESHSFNTTIAKELGIVPATLFNNFVNWYKLNKANNKHFHDERYWTYNSIRSFRSIYDYLTERQIRYGIEKLIESGYIITCNYNEKKYDQTLWYTLTDKSLELLGLPILQNCQMELTKLSNGVDKIVKPIPYINTNTITDTNIDVVLSEITEVVLHKPKKTTRAKYPTEQEVVDYFKQNGYTEQSALKAYKYYNDSEWQDSRGKKVINWKQKMISVWFKDENKQTIAAPQLPYYKQFGQ